MKHIFKTSLLALAISLGHASQSTAAFVVHARATETRQSTSSDVATVIASAASNNESDIAHAAPVAKKVKKAGFFKRVGRALRTLAGDNQLIAAILAFFVGVLGIHRFYLGYTTIGIIQAAMFLVGFLTSFIIVGIPILIALYIWVLIDFIRILIGSLKPKGGDYGDTL